DNVRYLDEWRAQHRRYYAAKTEALRGRRQRRAHAAIKPASPRTPSYPGYFPPGPASRPPGYFSAGQPAAAPSSSSRRWTWVLWCLPLLAGVGVWLVLTTGDGSRAAPQAVEAPPVLHLWTPGLMSQAPELAALVRGFEETHGVTVRWQAGPVDSWELIHAVMVGQSPDVVLVDQELGARLTAMNALLPLVPPAEGEPVQYTLPLGEETLWVRALRAAVPARSRHPDLARALVAYLASAAGAASGAGIH
ncbi:MAG TPA: hypothetical protein VIK93_06875, partial [Limnochordales bacterium]